MNKKWIYWVLALGALFVIIFFVFTNKPAIPVKIADIESPENEKNIPFIQIHDGCDWASVGTCVNMRSGPGVDYPVIGRLRNGIVLKVGDSVEVAGQTWYKIAFDAKLLYPERVEDDLYVAQSDSVKLLTDTGNEYASRVSTTTTKRIVVDVSEQMIYAYDINNLFMKESISTGLEFTPTPRGTFFILKKTPARYMQGPIKGVSDQKYDLPGVPWDLYFTNDGAVIHGAYWHDKFGEKWSHGCVNLPLESAEKLYKWADAGIPVVVQD